MTAVSWTFTTAAASSACPCTIWPSSATPAVAADPDAGGVEIGVKFRTTQAGTITGVRFYKGTGNTGTHVGSLWSRTGTKLASVTFTGESPSGWQEATFATPVSRLSQHNLRRVLLRTCRPLLRLGELLHISYDPRPADGSAEQRGRAERRVQIRH